MLQAIILKSSYEAEACSRQQLASHFEADENSLRRALMHQSADKAGDNEGEISHVKQEDDSTTAKT